MSGLEARREWAMWGPGGDDPQAYADLASFVVEQLHVGHRFNVNLRHDGSPAGIRDAAAHVYRAFQTANLPYRWQAWSPSRAQWIKDPGWFGEQSGTCLDFAVSFAAVLLAHDVAPVLAVRRGHAYVCVDLTRQPRRGGGHRGEPMFGGALGTGRVVRIGDDDLVAEGLLLDDNDRCVPVDITQSSSTALVQGRRPTFEDAMRLAQDGYDSRSDLWLVDVLGLQHDDPAIVRSPFDDRQRPRPAITTLVPDVATVGYRRQPAIEEAMADEGAVGLVLHGSQGVGKSLAALVGLKSQHALAGWFLNATDRDSLVTSLAFAELVEVQVRDSAIATGEEAKWFAGQAIARLGGDQPWMVVLDNAEAGPADIADILPLPRGEHGQRLVVTTTQDSWLRWAQGRPGWRVCEVPPFDDTALDEFGVPPDADLRRLIDGRGLFASAFGRAAAAGVDLQVGDGEPGSVDLAAALLWRAVRGHLAAQGDLGSAAIRCAQAAAYLQPDRIAEETLAAVALEGIGADAARQVVDSLVGTGVLSLYETGTVRIHRLVAEAVRSTTATLEALSVVGAQAYVEDARYRADTDTQRLLDELLRAPCDDHAAWVAAADGVIALLEHRGKAGVADATAAQIVSRLADVDRDTLDRDTALRLAAALHARARAVNQSAKAGPQDALAAITEFVDPSEQLRTAHRDDLGISKCTTIRALLMGKAAKTVEELLRSRDMLTRARDERRKAWGEVHEDTARAEFNLGNPNIKLAQRDPANAPGYLAAARSAYDKAWEIRRALFPTASHPFRAASEHGWALADYYEAVIVADDPVVRQALLRKAERHARDAALIRETLDGPLDLGDTIKSTSLAAKISDVRGAFAEHTTARLRTDRRAAQADDRADARWPEQWPAPVTVEGAANAEREVATRHADTRSELTRWGVTSGIALPLLSQPGLGCVVTTRHGGYGKQGEDGDGRLLDFGSLNLGDHVGDDPAVVRRNRALVCAVLGVTALTIADQQHGNRVAVIDEHRRFAGHGGQEESQRLLPATDGLVTDLVGTPLVILVADCVPVVLHDPVRRALGVAHAGRNGTVTGVVPAVIDTMRERFGTDPADLVVGFGPHVGAGDYEVGAAEVASFLDAVDGDEQLLTWTDREAGKASLDLEGALRMQLSAAGVPSGAAITAGVNTRRATHTFFSDRHARFDRRGAQCGRFALVSWLT
ncbi:MAG: Multi-copper polyphenol oxidoreductase, laccase [Actinomycetia bacterium]|nr:Multi-copper polyphenol oxidoreductase, laccase [Actinomycetes bacterium]